MKRLALAALPLAFAASAAPLAAQNDISTLCDQFGGDVQSRCAAVAQAVDAAQPQVGILMAGGNPTLGTASTGGVRLGILPRVSAGARLNVVFARLPDIRDENASDGAGTDRFSVPAPAIGGDVSIGVFPGISVAPTIGGIGAIDLLGSATLFPVSLAGVDGLERNPVSWGAGARVGLLRESFVTPGLSVSVMYRKMGDLRFGDVCEGGEVQDPTDANRSTCAGDGDFGEIDFGLSNLSVRAAVSKRLLGFGLAGGVGYDRFDTDADLAFRAPAVADVPGRQLYRFNDVSVENGRWSAFVNGSFTLLVGSIVAEAGWMQGQNPISGFPSTSDFDARDGTFFGSVGARLSL